MIPSYVWLIVSIGILGAVGVGASLFVVHSLFSALRQYDKLYEQEAAPVFKLYQRQLGNYLSLRFQWETERISRNKEVKW